MNFMFSGCESLTSIDLTKFNTKKVTNMIQMFSGCKSLKSIDLSKFDINDETNKTYMLVSNYNLNEVKLNKNFLQDIESLISNQNYNKKYYYLINSLKYKYKLSDERPGKYIQKE